MNHKNMPHPAGPLPTWVRYFEPIHETQNFWPVLLEPDYWEVGESSLTGRFIAKNKAAIESRLHCYIDLNYFGAVRNYRVHERVLHHAIQSLINFANACRRAKEDYERRLLD